MGIFLGVGKISNIFSGCLKFPIFLLDAGPEPTYEEKMRVPHPPPPGSQSTHNYGSMDIDKDLDQK